MDHFQRFLNPHVFLGCVKFLQLQTNKEKETLLNTRLFERLRTLGVNQQTIDQTIALDNLQGKLASAAEVLKLKTRALQDYVQDNLWTVEEAYQAIVILFDQGQYEKATEIVDNLCPCIEATEKLHHLKNGFLWARLNCKLVGFFNGQNTLLPCIDALKDLLNYDDQIQFSFKQRSDLLHVGVLISYFNDDVSILLELFQGEQYLEVVHTIAPYLLYYYAISLLFNQQQQGSITLAQIGQNVNKLNKKYYLLSFIEEIIIKFEFNNSMQLISKIEQEIEEDFLVKNKKDSIINACKLYFFASYIKIFNGVQIKQFSKYLSLNDEETELWLVNAIRILNISAKIDGDKIVVLRSDANAQNSQILKQLRDLQPRSNMLVSNLQRIINIK